MENITANNLFINRQSPNKNRFKITLDNGESYSATLIREDEPTIAGTKLTAEILNSVNDLAVAASRVSEQAKSKVEEINSSITSLYSDVSSLKSESGVLLNSTNKVKKDLENFSTEINSKISSVENFSADSKIDKMQGVQNQNKTLAVNTLGELELSDDLSLIKQILFKLIVQTNAQPFADLTTMLNNVPNNAMLKIYNLEEV